MRKREMYEKVLRGELAAKDARGASVRDDDFRVYVTPQIVDAMLARCAAGEFSVDVLSEWADFLMTYDIYVVEGWQEDEIADKFEPMWDVLQRVAAPGIYGPITREKIARDRVSLQSILREF